MYLNTLRCLESQSLPRAFFSLSSKMTFAESHTVTPEFEGKLECINYMCARIKLHTRNDSVNIRYSAKA
jgi:hypothetical protein